MPQRSLACLVALLMLVACGGITPGAPPAPPAAEIAGQPKALPSDMPKCDLSGDIDSFLNKTKTKDPNTYTSTKTEWDSAKQKGATAAYTAFSTDRPGDCAAGEDKRYDKRYVTYNV